MESKLEWDERKRQKTKKERGLDFADALYVFKESIIMTQEDTRQDYGEQRFITMGKLNQRLIVIAYTMRGQKKRIISMRKANAKEQKIFEQFCKSRLDHRR